MKRKISAKEAVSDIRSGMDNKMLMQKYNLSQEGLQSLFDKLVATGYLDVAEVEQRMPTTWGIVKISEPLSADAEKAQAENGSKPQPKKKSAWISSREVARDIRSGMDDASLMEKYRISTNGLQLLFNKLIEMKIITQVDLNRRKFVEDNTIDLHEDILPLLKNNPRLIALTKPQKPSASEAPQLEKPKNIDETQKKSANQEIQRGSIQRTTKIILPKAAWYDKSYIVLILLICIFPLGLYGLLKSDKFPIWAKILLPIAWIIILFGGLVLLDL